MQRKAMAWVCWSLFCACSDGEGSGGQDDARVSADMDGSVGEQGEPDATVAGDGAHLHDASVPDAASRANKCKRGVAYGHHSQADLRALTPALGWWYNWAYQPDTALRDGSYQALGIEYVPMIWGGTFDASAVSAAMPAGVKVLLGFNEPNFPAPQSNLSAAQAATKWPDVERVADEHDLLLVSPAVNFCGGNCQDTDPFHYLDSFFTACKGCRVDRVAFHIYVGCHPSGANKAKWLIDHVEHYKQRFTQPLWLTEFACTDAANFDEQVAFMKDAVAYLEQDARIERYAWFSGRFADIPYVSLLGGDGALTKLGAAYVQAPASADCER